MNQIHLLGLNINPVRMPDALAQIDECVRNGRTAHIVTADASMVVLARQDPELREIVNSAELVTPDGSGILWASRLLGKPVSERVSGVDLVDQLCRLSSEPESLYRVYFLGAAPGVAEKAAEKLRARHPGAQIVGTRDGYFQASEEDSVAEQVRRAAPNIVLVAFGIPKQEKFIRRHKSAMGAGIYIGVGGSFDVYSGLVSRAPMWMQNAGLEWVYRLWKNPKKITKVMTLPRFAALAIRARLTGTS